MRDIGLDVHLDFCEVAVVETGVVRSEGRIETKPQRLELFAQSLDGRGAKAGAKRAPNLIADLYPGHPVA